MNTEEAKTSSSQETQDTGYALDDARRIKVLSPSMMVFKRFVRNKLAIVGFVILVVMFIFSFLGPVFSPYSIAQLFTYDSFEWKTYATGRYNTDPNYIVAEGTDFPTGARSQFLLAVSGKTGGVELQTGDTVNFEYQNTSYTVTVLDFRGGKPVYAIGSSRFVASALLGKINNIDPEFDTPEIREALTARAADKKAKETTLEVGDYTFLISTVAKEVVFELAGEDSVLVSYDSFLALDKEYEPLTRNFAFVKSVYEAAGKNETAFEYNGKTYELTETDNETELSVDGTLVMLISDIVLGSYQANTILSSDFLVEASDAIRTNA